MSDSGNPTESLLNIGNFIILLVSGAIIPLLLVLYKSRCKRICWGCITRDVLDADPDEPDKKKDEPAPFSLQAPEPEPEPESAP